MAASVLVVDDERGVNDLICDAMRLSGFETVSARDGAEALQVLRETPVDLVILDVNMPKVDGFTVLARMREGADTTPVIILTARQGADDVRTGFELGADDFVRKPFGIEELSLRVSAVLRRTHPDSPVTQVRVGSVCLDSRRHVVTCGEDEVELSPTEFRLLQALMDAPGEVLSKEYLLKRLWGLDGATETTVVETYISYLRKRFGHSVSIRTVRGVGYEMLGERIRS